MKQSSLSQKEQDVLKKYFLNEIQKQLQPYTISHTDYFDGELTITNLEQIADYIKLEFEHSAATNRIYLRDVPNSQVALNEQDLPEFIKCIYLDGKNMQDIIDETSYEFTVITKPTVIKQINRDTEPDFYIAARHDIYEIMLHTVWGLNSLKREAQETYNITPELIEKWICTPHGYKITESQKEYDETYLPYLQKYFKIDELPWPTKIIYELRKTK